MLKYSPPKNSCKQNISKNIILFFFVILLMNNSLKVFAESYTIQSKISGGNWDDIDTWIENRLPNEDDIVKIDGVVLLNVDSIISGLVISSEGKLFNKLFDKTITINGNIVNNGIIMDNDDKYDYGLTLRISGNITNNGTWKNYSTEIIWCYSLNVLKYELQFNENEIWQDPITLTTPFYNISTVIYDTKYWRVKTYYNNNEFEFLDVKFINANKSIKYKLLISLDNYNIPLPNTSIRISKVDIQTITDNEGFFLLSDLPNDTYTIAIQTEGLNYETQIQIDENQEQRNNVFVKLPLWLESLIKINIIQKFDIHSDNIIGLEEAIHALNCASNIDHN